MQSWGFVRVTAANHLTSVANPAANADVICWRIEQFSSSDVIVLGELCLSGYTCGDLFAQDTLLRATRDALVTIVRATEDTHQLVVVGLPLRVADRLYNCAAAISAGQVKAIVPKQYLPNYQEFYEARWFAAAAGDEPASVDLGPLGEIPFGIDLLLKSGELVIGIEICEDLWMPIPPSSLQACAGANLLLNLSASNEIVGKAPWRELLVRSQSGRCLAAYAYASAGPSESTTDLVFGGHCLIAESGSVLAESARVGDRDAKFPEQSDATADIDLERLAHERQITGTWQQSARRSNVSFRVVEFESELTCRGERRVVAAAPFVPRDDGQLYQRCTEIFGIQCAALTKRVSRLPDTAKLVIGVSGGLDSTLALLVAVKACEFQGWPIERILGITLPGFGTTQHTLQSARQLMDLLQITAEEVDIRSICLDTFRAMGHRPLGIEVEAISINDLQSALQQVPEHARHDLVFENVQARVRTLLLMNRGFVLGTGDLSEQALGWSTYNGDHMSMYNVNSSIPKTLVRFLIRYAAQHQFSGPVSEVLKRIVETPISPELLPPGRDGSIVQATEGTLGPYELHDFFLYYLLRFGFSPSKILQLARLAQFSRPFSQEQIESSLRKFLTRFFANQFKRSCVPDGPKVGSVSLSPRGDWRMPSDSDADAWLSELDQEDAND